MSTKRDQDDDDDNDGDFRGDEYDEEEDEEDEFIPGEEEAEDDDNDGAGFDLMRGKCMLDGEKKLILQGRGFSLCSTEAFDTSSRGSSLLLVGTWQLEGADPKLKAPPRRINLSVAAAASAMVGKRCETDKQQENATTTGTKEQQKTMIFDIQGTEQTTCEESIQFFGQIVIGTTADQESRDFTCRLRRVVAAVAATNTAIPPPAAAAAVRNRSHNDDESDDDAEGEDADDDVDFDELAALHEEAGMSVDAVINKRYRERTGEGNTGDGSSSNKRGKTETDDEEDIEF